MITIRRLSDGNILDFEKSGQFIAYFKLKFWFCHSLLSIDWAGKRIIHFHKELEPEILMFNGEPILESNNIELIELFTMFMEGKTKFKIENEQKFEESISASKLYEMFHNMKSPCVEQKKGRSLNYHPKPTPIHAPTQFNCFPANIDPNNLEFESYVLGDRLVKSPTKDLQLFDAVSFLSENTSLKTNRKRIQALGTVYRTKKSTIINLRTKVA